MHTDFFAKIFMATIFPILATIFPILVQNHLSLEVDANNPNTAYLSLSYFLPGIYNIL